MWTWGSGEESNEHDIRQHYWGTDVVKRAGQVVDWEGARQSSSYQVMIKRTIRLVTFSELWYVSPRNSTKLISRVQTRFVILAQISFLGTYR